MRHGSIRERFRVLLGYVMEFCRLYLRWFRVRFRRELKRYPFWLMMALASSTLTYILSFAGPNLISYRLAYSRAYTIFCRYPSYMLWVMKNLGERLFPISPYYTEVFTIFTGFPLQALWLAFHYVVVVQGLRESLGPGDDITI